MPSSEYASAVSGGLRLKGAGIDKKKTKKKKPPPSAERSKPEIEAGSTANKEEQEIKRLDTDNDPTALQQALADEEEKAKEAAAKLQDVEGRDYGKTEAQRRYEQRRKKRLEERLRREGVQTHKERVQQLNKYLSTLSEHNDMPRIGPG